ncbi:MAG: hypothetical protein NZT92_14030, partial [Abditibacteriales bacterium]|nr:hypothetical protein [Abditibacteriales bacterium]MDW8367046.1 hypothetical protein [Abditibacteriales bacterium]
AAMALHRRLRLGYSEEIYQRGLAADLSQVISDLAMTGLPIGLLIDCGRRSLDFRHIFPPPDPKPYRVNHQWLFVPDRLKEGQERPK